MLFRSYLFKYVGQIDGKHYFEATKKLGYYYKGNKIFQYGISNSIIEADENILGINEAFKKTLFFQGAVEKVLEGLEQIGENSFKFEDYNNIFTVVPVVKGGNTYYQSVMEYEDNGETISKIVQEDLGESLEEATDIMTDYLSQMTESRLLTAINKKC